jgi:hypothetical protein
MTSFSRGFDLVKCGVRTMGENILPARYWSKLLNAINHASAICISAKHNTPPE